MKKIKVLVLALIVVVLTGCRGEYDLTINKDLTISEKVNLYVENVNDNYDKTVSLFENNDIDDSSYNITQNEEYVNIKYEETFKNFEDYFLNSKFYSRIVSDEDYKKDNKRIVFSGISNLKLDDNATDSDLNNTFNISDLKINLTIPFIIRDNNADEVINKTLTWNLDSDDTYRKFEFKFDYLRNNNLYLVIIILCSGIVLVSAFIFIRNYLKEKRL